MAQAGVVQPRRVTHGQMQHPEPAFHAELDLLMSLNLGQAFPTLGMGGRGHRHPTREPGDTRQSSWLVSGCDCHGWIFARSLLAPISCQFQQAGVCVCAG